MERLGELGTDESSETNHTPTTAGRSITFRDEERRVGGDSEICVATSA
jgi:hypothetical protein